MPDLSNIKKPANATAVLLLDDGTVFWGRGFGAESTQIGEVCFNTGMTGYQEVLTDPSYAAQIITFTFPHIGNTGTNEEDMECQRPAARGAIVREDITAPSNWRAESSFHQWMEENRLPGICGLDTRALTRRIRDHGAPRGLIAYDRKSEFDLPALFKQLQAWPGLEGQDLAKKVTCKAPYEWQEKNWVMGAGYSRQKEVSGPHVVAIDYGAKHNILRNLAELGCRVTVVPCTTTASDILALKPDGIFLSNGPGDPAATAEYAVPTIKALLKSGLPLFGICLGHQLLARALGAQTKKMHLGHRGANHPVKDLKTDKVEITSQNHGFEVLSDSLPPEAETTHISLFDQSNEGFALTDKPVFAVQFHPEASPGPHDSHYLFTRFHNLMAQAA